MRGRGVTGGLFALGLPSEVAVLLDPNPPCLGKWGLVVVVSASQVLTLLNKFRAAQPSSKCRKLKWFTALPCPPSPHPRIGFFLFERPGQVWALHRQVYSKLCKKATLWSKLQYVKIKTYILKEKKTPYKRIKIYVCIYSSWTFLKNKNKTNKQTKQKLVCLKCSVCLGTACVFPKNAFISIFPIWQQHDFGSLRWWAQFCSTANRY